LLTGVSRAQLFANQRGVAIARVVGAQARQWATKVCD
jgi:hypothetical protein